MSELEPLSIDDFPRFFRAVHGFEPFPWQQRLLTDVTANGWPSLLDLPTGTGKTTAIDIAVFHLALHAADRNRQAPLRILYVVDRRTIVDQAYRHAQTIQRALEDPVDVTVRAVKQRLQQLSGSAHALRAVLLRGGIAKDETWAHTPVQPIVAVSTVDQVGSRLLFRGYGLSDNARPIHAGLLGNDALYLLDEVHLSQPFRETLAEITNRYRRWADSGPETPFLTVEMSATAGASTGRRFELDEADAANPVLARRLTAAKPVTVVETPPRAFVRRAAADAVRLAASPGATVAVVVNRVDTAREAYRAISEAAPQRTRVWLITGRMRPFDRDAIENALLPRICSGRVRSAEDAPVIVVATQAIEAGADFDFDAIVTECASLDALRQRFGRLDRLGHLGGQARGVIIARTDTLEDDAVYGDAVGKTLSWLRSRQQDGHVDFGLQAMQVPDDAAELGLLSPRTHAPVLLPAHLDAWVQTSPTPEPDPDVSLWLHGLNRGAADVHVIWRADLTQDLLTGALQDSPEAVTAATTAIEIVEVIPPVAGEAMSVPFVAAKRWLSGLSDPPTFDVEGAFDGGGDKDERPSTPARPALVWMGDESRAIGAGELRPGQTIVVPASYGGIENGNWAPASIEPVRDVAELAALRQGRVPKLRVITSVTEPLFGATTVPKPSSEESADKSQEQDELIGWLDSITTDNAEVQSFLKLVRGRAGRLRYETYQPKSGEPYFVVVGNRRRPDAESGSSFTGVQVTLAAHLNGVARLAESFAATIGLPSHTQRDLCLSAQWHDAGKADRRFQQWLQGGSEFRTLIQQELLAKSGRRITGTAAIGEARERSGYPRGGRHELASLALVENASEHLRREAVDWDLVRHLVASHHGRCRPLAPFVTDARAESTSIEVTINGITSRTSANHQLERLDSGVADRFWICVRRYGWWGLALAETVMRLADQRQSENEQAAEIHNG